MWPVEQSLTEGIDMPCWVAPAVAAEMWGMPVDHVMAKIRDGAIPSKSEAGFLFVDIMPEPWAPSSQAPSGPPPETFVAVSDAELEALATPAAPPAPALAFNAPDYVSTPFVMENTIRYSEDEEGGVEPFQDEETPTFSAKDWRRVRAETGRMRKAPPRVAASAA
jgi:hypothetical protein